jgi:hypothetical protein
VCSSPSLIAAYHVLLRLHAPRHPPCALSSLPKYRPSLHTIELAVRARTSVGNTYPPKICVRAAFYPLFLFTFQRASPPEGSPTWRRSPVFWLLQTVEPARERPGGGEGTRTPDPLLAKQVLCQLSYTPTSLRARVVGLGRLELPTSRLSGVRSNHLSYRPTRRLP